LIVSYLVKKFPAFYLTEVYYCVRSSFLKVPIQSHMNIVHTLTRYIILRFSSHLRLGLPSGLFPSGFSNQNFVRMCCLPIRCACLSHFIFLDLIILIISDGDSKLWSCSLCSFHRPPAISSLVSPNIFLST
jgi:hypothetical protein